MNADSGVPLRELRVDGGAAANDFLMQFQADLLGVPVDRPALVETTAAGAGFLPARRASAIDPIQALRYE
jgi:glycerol kinase